MNDDDEKLIFGSDGNVTYDYDEVCDFESSEWIPFLILYFASNSNRDASFFLSTEMYLVSKCFFLCFQFFW